MVTWNKVGEVVGYPVVGDIPDEVLLPFELSEEIVDDVARTITGSRPMVRRISQHIFMRLAGYKIVRQEDGEYRWV
jgi:hypothetical protein